MEIQIRKLKKEDISQICLIENASFSMPWSEKSFLSLLKNPYCMYLTALVEEKVAGFCGMTILCGEGSIDHVVVAEEYRQKGIAQAMLTELLSLGEAQGVKDFTLEVRVSNVSAIHIYEKCGFVSEGIRPHFYEKPVEDAIIMWRRH